MQHTPIVFPLARYRTLLRESRGFVVPSSLVMLSCPLSLNIELKNYPLSIIIPTGLHVMVQVQPCFVLSHLTVELILSNH